MGGFMLSVRLARTLATVCALTASLSTPSPCESLSLPEAQPPQLSALPSIPPGILRRARAGARIRIIVGLRTPVPLLLEDSLAEQERGEQRRMIRSVQDSFLQNVSALAVSVVRRFVIIPAMAMEVDGLAFEALVGRPELAYIEEDLLFEPALSESTGIIGAGSAWHRGYTGLGATVAIVDSGVDRTRLLSADRIVSEACYSTTSAADGSVALCTAGSTAAGAGGGCGLPGCAHGTSVAAIAAANENPPSDLLLPRRGVAPGATLIAVQVFSGFYGFPYCPPANDEVPTPTWCIKAFTSDVLAGLERVYELRDGFDIAAVNLSLELRGYSSQVACDAEFPSYTVIIGALRAAGIATVVSAGNGGFTNALSAPACVSSAISVSSTKDGTYWNYAAWPPDAVSSFSNSAPLLKLLAPGELIQFSPEEDGLRGTSMSAAHVTGAWAMLKGRFSAASVDDILAILETTGAPITDSRNGLTKSRINVFDAINAMGPLCSHTVAPTELRFGWTGGTATVTVSTTADCPWTVFAHEFYLRIQWPASGTGNGSFTVTVERNPSGHARDTVLDIVDRQVVIHQDAAPLHSCRYLLADLDGDRKTDVVCHDTQLGDVSMWLLEGETVQRTFSWPAVPLEWQIAGIGDVDGDGRADVVWRHVLTGDVAVWLMNGTTVKDAAAFWLGVPLEWQIAGIGDVDGDERADVVWRHVLRGDVAVWLMNGTTVKDAVAFWGGVPLAWQIAGMGDVDADGRSDVFWRHTQNGDVAVWLMNGTRVKDAVAFASGVPLEWQIVAIGDADGNGKADLLWRLAHSGDVSLWLLDGTTIEEATVVRQYVPAELQIVGTGHGDNDGKVDLYWRHTYTGDVSVWLMSGSTIRNALTVLIGTSP
jgi:hypothetical protein